MELYDIFQEACTNFSDRNCVIYNDTNRIESYSYREIEVRVDRIAEEIRKRTKGESCYLLFYLNDTKIEPVLILGCLKSSCAFFYSDSETEFFDISTKLKPGWLLTDRHCEQLGILKWENHGTVGIFGSTITFWKTGFKKQLEANFAFAIQSSGTTGTPKMVQVPSASSLSNILHLKKLFDLTEFDVILQSTPFTFDPSLIEIFLAFASGSALCLTSSKVRLSQHMLLEVIKKSKVSFIQMTPSLFRRFPKEDIKNICAEHSSLKTLVLGGEKFPTWDELQYWGLSENSKIKIFDIYGITEVSCWAACLQVWPSTLASREEIKDIGQALDDTILKLISAEGDENRNMGELYIGSNTRICVINDEKYHELLTQKPIFRKTGDIFREADEKFYFVRRKSETMFKRWGLNIDCHQLEELSFTYPSLTSCCAVSVEFESNCFLGLFVSIPAKDFSDFQCKLQQKRKSKFPKGYWPDYLLRVDELPLTNHGKINRLPLQKMLKDEIRRRVYKESPSELRKGFEKLWKYLTGCSLIQDESTFLANGGDSISALQLVTCLGNDPESKLLGLLLGGATFKECLESMNSEIFGENASSSDFSSEQSFTKLPLKKFKGINENKVTMLLKGRRFTNFGGPSLSKTLNSEHNELTFSWKLNMKKCVDASPLGVIIHRNQEEFVIIGSHSGLVLAIWVKSGRVISEVHLNDRVESSACLSSCTNYYYIGCYDGCIYCVSVMKGDVQWKFQTGDMIKSTCVLIEDKIIFGSYDKFVYCLSEDGNLIWKTMLNAAILAEVLIVHNSVFVPGLSGGIWALDLDTGEIKWNLKTPPIFTNPVLISKNCDISERFLLISPVLGGILFVDPDTGVEVNCIQIDGHIFSSPVLSPIGSSIIQLVDEIFNYITITDENWSIKLDYRVVATPFFFSSSEKVLVPLTDGKIKLIDLDKRNVRTAFDLGAEVFSSPVIFPSGAVVFGSRDDHVYCFKF